MQHRYLSLLAAATTSLAACGDEPGASGDTPSEGAPSEDSPSESTPADGMPAQETDGGHTESTSDNAVTEALQATALPIELESPRPYLRLDLSDDGALSILRADRPTLSLAPVAATAPQYLVAAYAADGALIDVTPIAFSHSTRDTAVDDQGRLAHAVGTDPVGTATAYLHEAQPIDRVDVLDGEDVVLTLDGAALEALRPAPRGAQNGTSPLARSRRALTLSQLDAKYPGIYFALPGDEATFTLEAQRRGQPLLAIEDDKADAIDKALQLMPPALLASISTIGVVRWPTQGKTRTLANVNGSRMLLNAEGFSDPRFQSIVVHEAMHCFANLSVSATQVPEFAAKNWPSDVIAAAADVMRRHNLREGLEEVWLELHESGREEGYTTDFTGSGWTSSSDAAAAAGGFASAYGSSSHDEDIAEFASVPSRPGGVPALCALFSGATRITPQTAIPYAKLTLLRSVGALSEQAFQTCTQGLEIAPEPGFSFDGYADFSQDLKGGWLDGEDGPTFGVLGTGPNSYSFMVEVALPASGSPPLGLHRLDSFWLGSWLDSGARSAAYLANGDDNWKARASASGLVLVTRADAERKEGAIFGLRLQNAGGLVTDSWPFGTFQVR